MPRTSSLSRPRSARCAWARALGAACFASALLGQSPQLAVDFDATPIPLGSDPNTDPRTSALSGPYTYFWATTPAEGSELWRTDGTASGTLRVRDLAPGVASSEPETGYETRSMLPFSIGGVPGLLFCGVTETEGAELWWTDGSTAGTRLVADIAPGPSGSRPDGFAAVGSLVYFSATDAPTGRELWVTDGTGAGTRLVADLYPGPTDSWPASLTASPVAGELIFSATAPGVGMELFRSGGQAASTSMLADIELGSNASAPGPFVRLGNQLLFTAFTFANGRELYATRGTPATTGLYADIDPGPSGSGPRLYDSAIVGGRLYFPAADARGTELWSTDGSPGGTRLEADIEPGPIPSFPTGLVGIGNTLFFGAATTSLGFQTYSLGGGGPPAPVAGLPPYTGTSQAWIAPVRGGFVALAKSFTGATELWTSVPSIQRISTGVVTAPLAPLANGSVLFGVEDASGAEPWVTDGTAAGTAQLLDIVPGQGSRSSYIMQVEPACGDRLFVAADDNASGFEPWIYEPGVGATSLGDIQPGAGSSSPFLLASTPTFSLFAAFDPTAGYEPYVFGTTGGARLLRDIVPGSAGSFDGAAPSAAAIGERIVFMAGDAAGFEPWVTDGTNAGTLRLADIAPGAADSLAASGPGQPQFTAFRGRVYFVAWSPGAGSELWATDGTPSGTTLVADVAPGVTSSVPAILGAFAGRLWFTADTPATGRELWATDGTANGTVLVADLEPGPGASDPTDFVVAGSRSAFVAESTAFGRELYVSDGTANGTARLTDLAPGPASANLSVLTAAEDLVYFASTVAYRPELWVSDLTVAGTRAVGASVQVRTQAPAAMHAVGRRVQFVGATALLPTGLWESDGTAAGTRWIAPKSARNRVPWARYRGATYTTIDDPVAGIELFRIDDPGALVEDLGNRCGPAWAELASTAPVLGGTITVTGRDAPAGHVGFGLLADPKPRSPLMGILVPGCASYAFPALDYFAVTTTSSWQAQLAVPNTPALSGLSFHLQAAYAPIAGAGAGAFASTSNALRVTVGR